jgi:hypothetical protein
MVLADSGVMVLVYAFGVGFVGIGVLLIAVFGMLEPPDRKALLNIVRHPVRVIFGQDAPPED